MLTTPYDQMTTPSNTEQASKKTTTTTTTNSHLITPPRSTEQHHCSSPQQTEKNTMVNKHIFNAALFVTSTWRKHHDIPSLFASSSSASVSATSFTTYLTEILRRSRCSISALHAALFYIHKLTDKIHSGTDKNLSCPKKTLLVCLILSFKFQYDSTYNLKAWSKISGLSVGELKQLEMGVLNALDYQIALNNKGYESWLEKVEAINSTMSTANNKRAREDETLECVKKVKVSCA